MHVSRSSASDRSDLLERAARLAQRGDLDAAIREYARLFEQNPRDLTIGNTLGDLYQRAGDADKAVAQFMGLAAQLASDGFAAKARALYKKVLRLQPAHEEARRRVDELEAEQAGQVSPFLQRVLDTARASRDAAATPRATVDAPRVDEPPRAAPVRETTAADDYVCLVRIAPPQPKPAPAPAPAAAPAPAPELEPEPEPEPTPALALAVAPVPVFVDAASDVPPVVVAVPPPIVVAPVVVDTPPPPPAPAPVPVPAARPAVVSDGEDEEWKPVDLSSMADEPPDDQLDALERLVEAEVETAREESIVAAQMRLAEACLSAGRFAQARHIADDLCDREPDAPRHRELLDRVTAVADQHGLHFPSWVRIVHEPTAPPARVVPPVPRPMPPAVTVPPREIEAPPARVDAPAPPPARSAAPAHDHAHDDLLAEWRDADRVFEDVRTSALERAAALSEERLAEAARLADQDRLDEAAAALEEAMCTPALRATAGSRLAHLLLDRGEAFEALALLEWVAEMPPATEEGGHELAYDLALTLEALGENAQALGVYRELLAEVGPEYRDIAARAEQLALA